MSSFLSRTFRASMSSLGKPWSLNSVRNCYVSNLPGSGAGKAGGAGSSSKDTAGGRFGAAREEGYFYEQEKEKLSKLKNKMKENLALHQKEKKPDK